MAPFVILLRAFLTFSSLPPAVIQRYPPWTICTVNVIPTKPSAIDKYTPKRSRTDRLSLLPLAVKPLFTAVSRRLLLIVSGNDWASTGQAASQSQAEVKKRVERCKGILVSFKEKCRP